MADWPLEQISRMDGVRGANPFLGVTVTSGGSSNTKGSWTRIANAPFDSTGIVIMFTQHVATSDYLFDIGAGASGAETVVIADLMTASGSSSSRGRSFYFPLQLGSGTRVAMRSQNATASSNVVVDVFFMGESFLGSPSFQRFATYGAVTSTSGGVVLGTNVAVNSWGAWTQIVDATAWDHAWVLPNLGDNNIVTRSAGQRFCGQMGVGAAGSEAPCSPPIWIVSNSTSFSISFQPGWYYQLARGQRLSMRCASNLTTTVGSSGIIYAGIVG